MTADLAWINGTLRPASEATVSIFDHGLTVGDGVFETLKAVQGVPFAARRHLARLHTSADALSLDIGATDDELRGAMAAVLGDDPPPLARVRITVTGGPAPLGSDRGDGPATVIVATGPLAPAAATTSACTVPWPRNERSAVAGIKSTSYAENVRALALAKAGGCTEALFPNTVGMLCEGTGSNVFVVLGGRLLTPPLSAGCLAGVTRDLVLEVTDALEEDVPIEALSEAEEVFLASTGRDVQPVHCVDGRTITAPGPRTAMAARAFAELAASTSDP
ncbi:MAG: aminotransferase class IV [Acidimicrobiales bacterium]|nr:aminotransferase class IV [Acidimicrobiales bacterium]